MTKLLQQAINCRRRRPCQRSPEDGSHIEADGVGEYLLPKDRGSMISATRRCRFLYGGVMPIRFTRRELAMVGASTLGAVGNRGRIRRSTG